MQKVLEKLDIKNVMEAVGTEDAEGIDNLWKVNLQISGISFIEKFLNYQVKLWRKGRKLFYFLSSGNPFLIKTINNDV